MPPAPATPSSSSISSSSLSIIDATFGKAKEMRGKCPRVGGAVSATSLGRESFGSSSLAAHAFPLPFPNLFSHWSFSLSGFSLWPFGWGFPTPPFLCVYIIERCGEFVTCMPHPDSRDFALFRSFAAQDFHPPPVVYGGWSFNDSWGVGPFKRWKRRLRENEGKQLRKMRRICRKFGLYAM